MLTLSHIFGRRLISRVLSGEQAEIIRRLPSQVYLGPLPAEASNIFIKHNQSTLHIFTSYVKTFAAQHLHEYENCLPLSGVAVGAPSTRLVDYSDVTVSAWMDAETESESEDEWLEDSEEDEELSPKDGSDAGSVITDWDHESSASDSEPTTSSSKDDSDADEGEDSNDSLDADSETDSEMDSEASASDENVLPFLPNLPAPKARSLFVALSGHGDDFSSIDDLCSSVREGVFLESAVIPHLQVHPKENKTPLNAYLLDFYMHGAVQPLEKANGIRKSDVSGSLQNACSGV